MVLRPLFDRQRPNLTLSDLSRLYIFSPAGQLALYLSAAEVQSSHTDLKCRNASRCVKCIFYAAEPSDSVSYIVSCGKYTLILSFRTCKAPFENDEKEADGQSSQPAGTKSVRLAELWPLFDRKRLKSTSTLGDDLRSYAFNPPGSWPTANSKACQSFSQEPALQICNLDVSRRMQQNPVIYCPAFPSKCTLILGIGTCRLLFENVLIPQSRGETIRPAQFLTRNPD